MAINKKWNMHYFVFIILIIYPSLYYSDLACKIYILNDLFFYSDQPSDSEKENLPQKSHPAATNEIVESDDEFDHFYD